MSRKHAPSPTRPRQNDLPLPQRCSGERKRIAAGNACPRSHTTGHAPDTRVSVPGDPGEREAERAAEDVMLGKPARVRSRSWSDLLPRGRAEDAHAGAHTIATTGA